MFYFLYEQTMHSLNGIHLILQIRMQILCKKIEFLVFTVI